jgi:broad specificity phosphatase PhoE
MKTLVYFLVPGATEASLARPPRLQGRWHDLSLAPLGNRQAEATRDFLAVRPMDVCYTSPLLRAAQTASIIVEPHQLVPQPHAGLVECDLGRWEGQDWQAIRYLDATNYRLFRTSPAKHGYPGGESFDAAAARMTDVVEELFKQYPARAILLVTHPIITSIYLATLLGLSPTQARLMCLDECGISVIVREGDETTVTTLNAAFHLQGIAA